MPAQARLSAMAGSSGSKQASRQDAAGKDSPNRHSKVSLGPTCLIPGSQGLRSRLPGLPDCCGLGGVTGCGPLNTTREHLLHLCLLRSSRGLEPASEPLSTQRFWNLGSLSFRASEPSARTLPLSGRLGGKKRGSGSSLYSPDLEMV